MSVDICEGKGVILLYLFTLSYSELRLQTKQTIAPIYKKWTTLILPIISC